MEIMAAWYKEIDRFARRKKKLRRILNPTVAEAQAFDQEVQTHAVSISYFRDQNSHIWKLVEELLVYRKVVERFLAFMCLQRQSLCEFGKLPVDLIRMVGSFLVKKVHFSESEVHSQHIWMEAWEMSAFWEVVYCKYYSKMHSKGLDNV
jgi:hypothetical protein